MDARFLGLESMFTTLGINSAKTFQMWYNSGLKGRETQDLNIAGCQYAPAQADFTAEFLESTGVIKTMATIVDPNSEPLARGKEVEIKKHEFQIPRQKVKVNFGENDMRKQIIELNKADANARLGGNSPYATVRDFIANRLYDSLAEIPDQHVQRLNFLRGQMFGKHEVILNADNNQSGIALTLKSAVPDGNIVTEQWYTTASDGAVTYVESADPILTLKKKTRALRNDHYHGYRNITVEMNASTFFTVVEHPKVLQKLGYLVRPEFELVTSNDSKAQTLGKQKLLSMSDELLKEWFKEAIGADELLIDTTLVGAARLDASSKKFVTDAIDAFPVGVVLVRPSGIVSDIFNVTPYRPDAQAIYTNIFGGRGIIEYFYNARQREQTWISEFTALPVLTRPGDMYYYNVAGKTATYTPVVSPSGNPKAQGYYEKNGSGEYVLTEDTSVQSNKTYYTKS